MSSQAGGKKDISGLHQELVDQLKQRGLFSTPAVEAAFRAVPRHLFLPQLEPEEVYRDQAIPTKKLDELVVSSSSQPAIMATMLEQLALQPGQRILEIGAGTGYNAALLSHIVGEHGQVTTIDIDEDLAEGARAHLAQAGFNQVQVLCADGARGYAAAGPYDRIMLTVQASDIAPAWFEQLKPGGLLLLPLSINGPQVTVAFEKVDDGLESRSVKSCSFVGIRGSLASMMTTIRLPTVDGFSLTVSEGVHIDQQNLLRWLEEPYQDVKVPLQVAKREAYFSLPLWLALHSKPLCNVAARGAFASRGTIPDFFSFSNKNQVVHMTLGILSEQGLSLLAKKDIKTRNNLEPQTQLWVRCFGSDRHTVEQVCAQILAWDEAGRPNEQRLVIKAHARYLPYAEQEGEIAITKQWTRFILSWG
ncbi:methyltransferase, FxLD system [Ktedonosporobacter rubrisoli]|uniref:Protein-L-isoaspartate O-methyltransferase n=1 Tax=Ktedonosporobacter rubrisoli TaxID=2509675 RepID=A0A4P6JYT0_KTERU|nr:methyltransferase, FxLD system [Ktedonosporobacter rubrisoli]QBD80620.1 methyltransferase, FxLD system [Ktedonosporobacter rubrisoli]